MQVTEITFTIRRDSHTRQIIGFKVWMRAGLAGTDPKRQTIYEGDNFVDAYAALTRAAETY